MKQPKLKIIRYVRPLPESNGYDVHPTMGLLFIDDQFFCYTLEPSWKNNGFNSCIPDGTYKLLHYTTAKYGKCLIIGWVKKRTGILIHRGNTSKDTTGCILVGHGVGFIDSSRAVLNSAVAFMSLMTRLSRFNKMKITIKTICKKWGDY